MISKPLFEATRAYFTNPSGYNRERCASLIAQGHLSAQDVERLRWALAEYDKKVQATA